MRNNKCDPIRKPGRQAYCDVMPEMLAFRFQIKIPEDSMLLGRDNNYLESNIAAVVPRRCCELLTSDTLAQHDTLSKLIVVARVNNCAKELKYILSCTSCVSTGASTVDRTGILCNSRLLCLGCTSTYESWLSPRYPEFATGRQCHHTNRMHVHRRKKGRFIILWTLTFV